ncbi:MAG: BON domain-containing protein [Desulfobacterales bacterium]|jgi:osmotically-inducible protein OsmY
MRLLGKDEIKPEEPMGKERQMFVVFASILLLAAVIFLTGFAADTRAAGIDLSDTDITKAVENNLREDPAVFANLIDVTTLTGVVTLSGRVPNLLSSERAVRIAESIKGVRAVVNTLQVVPPLRSDQNIRRDIEDALLADPAADSYEIRVMVENGIATLTGTVESRAEKQLAGRVAKAVRGLKQLNNDIMVKHVANRSDEEIKRDIEGRLKWNVYVDDILIDVNVTFGNVVLSGIVGSAAEKTQAIQDVWVAGVRSVDATGLEVEWWTREEMRKKQPFVAKPDEEIKKAVEDAFLYDPRVASFKVDVEVDMGLVTLNGVVDSLIAKRSAEMDARHTAGVRWVENRLKVRTAEPPADYRLEEDVRNALQRNNLLERYEFTVSVLNQTAYLYGTVDSHYEKMLAKDVASRVVGVTEVANYITVSQVWQWKSDAEIKADVEGELFWSPYVDSEDITVKVEDGDVTLEGVATDWAEADAAVGNAFEGGARSVRARLDLADGSEYVRYYAHDYEYYWYGHFYGTL